jgi:methyl-accepting chemotaxis protein
LIAKIRTKIGGVHDTASTIALSIKEQVQATMDISNTITEVSKNSEEVSLRISHSKDDEIEPAENEEAESAATY